MGSDADFTPLGDIEFENVTELFEFCELGRRVASNSGLIVMQGAYDIQQALSTIATMDRRPPHIRARRVARHARRAGELLHATQASFAKVPRAFLSEYQDVIGAKRQRKVFDMKGL
ncbi:hypothetical protein PSN13_06479 [Micromonospora saelicesensis]|uniref:Uncharacterized protein n=1 Tax=Micromonospora saelicesensis TaxID=285676 RepID=A0A328NII4_9ACTN|nr:hypothetical protein [Micromonospora saelicesensis]RAO26451.1 hypothetical protein PSN13_06479 [Micromonospora saelicesensis]